MCQSVNRSIEIDFAAAKAARGIEDVHSSWHGGRQRLAIPSDHEVKHLHPPKFGGYIIFGEEIKENEEDNVEDRIVEDDEEDTCYESSKF